MYRLSERITQDSLWDALEQAAIQMVTAGGMAAMGFYRDAWKKQILLDDQKKNPSTLADLQATVTILKTGHSLLHPLAGRLGCGLSYLGEETSHHGDLSHVLSDDILTRTHGPNRFFATHENTLRVIFDGIDGTANFNRGLPLFCSAAALLVDDQVRVGAIYDPIHHQVYSAVLPGSYRKPDGGASAFAWEVATGNRVDLKKESERVEPQPLAKEAVGIHLTRSNPDKLADFLRPRRNSELSMLERLTIATSGVYAMNSGIVALKEIARGALGGFVNIVTNPWDIAAGEVLVRACSGKVTGFEGKPLTYHSIDKVSVVAAKGHLHNDILAALS